MTLLRRSRPVETIGDGRTLEGMALTWDEFEMVTEDHEHGDPSSFYPEAFAATSVTRTLRARSEWPLFVMHAYLAGSAGETTFHATGEGLAWRARLTDSKFAGAVRDRVIDPHHPEHLGAVSLGFKPLRHVPRPGPGGIPGVYRTEIAIGELSLADEGQRSAGKVLAVRSAPATSSGTPKLDAARRRRARLLMP